MDESTSPGWLLAIDTATEQAGIALTDGVRTGELSWPSGRSQTVSVLAEIQHLCELLGVGTSDVGAVGVTTGPGTFTGLRVGVSLAKGLALARGLPLVGVPTLDVAAAPYALHDGPVIVVLAAGRGRVVWARYERGVPAGPPQNMAFSQCLEAIVGARGVYVAGELTTDQRARLRDAGVSRVEAAALQGRRPAALAALAWTRWHQGDTDDLMMLEPVYLHGAARPASPITDRLRTGS